MIDKLKELHEDLTRRAAACRSLAPLAIDRAGTERCAGKAAAYKHVAQLVQALIDESSP